MGQMNFGVATNKLRYRLVGGKRSFSHQRFFFFFFWCGGAPRLNSCVL
jgi:hypothetical protein